MIHYQDDAVTLHQGDCREVLPTLATSLGESAALVLTDMPYGIGGGAAFIQGGKHAGAGAGAGFVYNHDNTEWNLLIPMEQWMPEVARLLVPGGHLATFHNFRTIEATLAAIAAAGLVPWTRFWWFKPNPPMNLRRAFQSGVEECVLAYKPPPPRRWFGGGATLNYWHGPSPSRERGAHPCAKPEPALRRLIQALSDVSELVLDPFAGGGSTLRAAKDTGRRAIGIEINTEYCRDAAKLLSQESLFGGAASPREQRALFTDEDA